MHLGIPMVLLCLVSVSCTQKETFDNPFDPNNSLTPPADLQIASFTDSTLSLTWENSVEINGANQNALSKVIIEQSEDGTSFDTLGIASAASTGVTIKKHLLPNQIYYFRIHDQIGSRVTSYSNIASGILSSSPVPSPTNFKVDTVTETARTFTWVGSATNTAGYRIERKVGNGGFYNLIGEIPANVTSFVDTSVMKTDTAYCYRLYAFSGTGILSPADTLHIFVPFSPPSNIVCTGSSPNELTIEWNNKFYRPVSTFIERSTDGINFSEVGVYSGYLSSDGLTSVVCQNGFGTVTDLVTKKTTVSTMISSGSEALIARAGADSTFVVADFDSYGGPYISVMHLNNEWVATF